MENYRIEKDIQVLSVTADSFPGGIMAAHHTLHAVVPSRDRVFYGISFPEKGVIVYKAAAEQKNEKEAAALGLETFTIRQGLYRSIVLKDYFKKPQAISQAFQQLLAAPDLDPKGACIEMYVGERDVRCMVRTVSV